MGDKRGEADHIEPEPRIGSKTKDAGGRIWVKVRHLGQKDWGIALKKS